MDYGNLLKRAWTVLWTNKILVVFMVLPFVFTFLMSLVSLIDPIVLGEWLFQKGFIWLYLALSLAILGLIMLLTLYGQAVVMMGTWLAERDQMPVKFGKLLAASFSKSWRVIAIALLFGVGMTVVFGILSCLPIGLAVVVPVVGLLCLMPFFIILIPVSLVVNVWTDLSAASAVSEGRGVFEAIQRAWLLIKQKRGPVAVIALILIFGRMALSLIVVLPFYALTMIPIFLIMSGQMTNGQADPVSLMHTFDVGEVIYLPFMSIGQALILTYGYITWTLAYLHLAPAPAITALPSLQGVQNA